MNTDDLAIQNAANLHALVEGALATPRPLDPYTLAVAEKAVRDRILSTHWASEARLLRFAADAIHKLGDDS